MNVRRKSNNNRSNFKIALCFLVVKNLNNLEVWKKWISGNEDLVNIYVHISGENQKNKDFWDPFLWENRTENHGVKAVKTKWGNTSLTYAAGTLYKAALKNTDNKYFCFLSEACIPLISLEKLYQKLKRSTKSYVHTENLSFKERFPKECFPQNFRPENENWKKTWIWTILDRWGANEYKKMIENKSWMHAFDNCYTFLLEDQEYGVGGDEVPFPNWIIHNYGIRGLNKRFYNYDTTITDFPDGAFSPIEHKNITPRFEKLISKRKNKPFFARKFKSNPRLANSLSKKYWK